MNISEIVRNTFIPIQGAWPVQRSIELIRKLKATHVIVHCRGSRDVYLLFTKSQALNLLERHDRVGALTEVLLSRETHITPLVESSVSRGDAPQRRIIVEDGNIVGFVDPAYQPLVTRGGELGSTHDDINHADVIASSLVAELPEKIALGQEVSLLLYLSAETATSPSLLLELRHGVRVDVVIQAKGSLALVGNGEGYLIAGDDEAALQFKVKGVALGTGSIRVFAFQQGKSLGSIRLAPTVVEAGGEITASPLKVDRPLRSTSVDQPDLSLLIFEETLNGSPAFTLRLTAVDPSLGLHFKKYGPVPLRGSPLQYFQQFFQDIENLSVESPEQQAIAMARLEAKGSHLFESVIPKEMQREIWRLRASITSVWVESEEPWVPWELCKMSGEEDGRLVDGPFFCEAFNLTRWLPEVPLPPKLTLENMALIVPQDSRLAYAPAEQDYILSLVAPNRKVSQIPATFLDVRSALAKGEYDGLHFSGHGIARADEPNRSQIILEKEGELTPEDLSGVVGNLGLKHPFVFLNACQSGRSGMSLTDIGGWAKQFLNAGAGAFVGTYWSIYDQSAYKFTKVFYDQLLKGRPVGEVTREAREAIRVSGDPTWLAYTVFADPLAVLRGTR